MLYASGFFPLANAVHRNSAAVAAAAALNSGRIGGMDSADIDVDGDSDDNNSAADVDVRHQEEEGERRRYNGKHLIWDW